MRFTCEHCGTRYAIPDERVAGRVLKIRCKRCRGVVEVLGPPPPGSTGSAVIGVEAIDTKVERVEPLHARPQLEHRLQGVHLPAQISDVKRSLPRARRRQEPAADGWWIGLQGQPTGPLGPDELLIHAQRGTLTLRTYTWRPGQGAWLRVDRAPGLGFVRDAIQRRQRQASQPRPMTGMESGVFAASGLFDASALAAALQQRARPVEPERTREPSGLTQALAHDAAPVASVATTSAPDDAPAPVAVEAPVVEATSEELPAPIEARPEPTLTINLEDSGWFVVDERLQQTLWQRELPPDLPGTTALITGVHLLPRRRRLKAAATVLVVGALVFASALLVAWVTRDSLALALAPVPGNDATTAESYSPARALVERVRQVLDPERGKGVRLPLLEAPAPAAAATTAGRASSAGPRVTATPIALENPAPVADAAVPVATPRGTEAVAVLPPETWTVPPAPLPTLQLGAPLQADSPELLLPGELTPEHVARVVQQRLPQLETAYNAALKRNPALAGVVDTAIVIGRDGRVQQVTVQVAGAQDAYLASLLRQRMARWTFPRPATELEVVLPLRFKSVY